MDNWLLRLRMMRPLFRLICLYVDNKDPWQKLEHRVPYRLFGRGSIRDFRWYFEGESSVPVRSVDHICRWLAKCQCLHDSELFHESDFWQHPKTFERVRKGDCEDHALWAWRKLSEIDFEAKFFTGMCDCSGDPSNGGHAWVVFQKNGADYLLESVEKARDRMIRPLDEVRHQYVPHFSVDQNFRVHVYVGYLNYLLEVNEKGKSSRSNGGRGLGRKDGDLG
jgi:hypothetical protein